MIWDLTCILSVSISEHIRYLVFVLVCSWVRVMYLNSTPGAQYIAYMWNRTIVLSHIYGIWTSLPTRTYTYSLKVTSLDMKIFITLYYKPVIFVLFYLLQFTGTVCRHNKLLLIEIVKVFMYSSSFYLSEDNIYFYFLCLFHYHEIYHYYCD